jgi:hypothetical protein
VASSRSKRPGCEPEGAISARFSAFDWKVGLLAREVLRSPKKTHKTHGAGTALERSAALRYNLGMKPAKSLMKQAEKAEAVAQRSEDIEHAERMRNLAEAFRAQAEMLKAKKKRTKVKK